MTRLFATDLDGTLLQSSLEIYAPLSDATFASGAPVENRAQSLTAFTAGTFNCVLKPYVCAREIPEKCSQNGGAGGGI